MEKNTHGHKHICGLTPREYIDIHGALPSGMSYIDAEDQDAVDCPACLKFVQSRKENTMEENPREMQARAPRRDRNRDIIERTLALIARAHGLSGEVTYNSATEDPARAAKIDAFKANIDAGLTMGKDLMALYKA